MPGDQDGEDSIASRVRSGSRERTLTERGMTQLIIFSQRNLRVVITEWRNRASNLEGLWPKASNYELMTEQLDGLQNDMKAMTSAYEDLIKILSNDDAAIQHKRYEVSAIEAIERDSSYLSDINLQLPDDGMNSYVEEYLRQHTIADADRDSISTPEITPASSSGQESSHANSAKL